MKLLTKEIEKRLEKNPLYKHDGKKPEDVKVIVKFFNPYGRGSWYVTEAERQENSDWLFYGLADVYEPEMGYFSFKELSEIRIELGGYGVQLERDMHFKGTLKDAYEDCEY